MAAMEKNNKTLNVPNLRFPEFSGEWELVALKEVADFANGKAHEDSVSEDGKYILINSKFISTEGKVKKYTDKQLSPLYKNQIVMVMSDLPNGKALAKCYYINEDDKYTLNQRICSLTPTCCDSRFLLYQINRNKYYLRFDDGVYQTNLKKGEVLNCPVYLPSSNEQQKISALLSLLDQRIATQKKVIEKYESLIRGLYHSVFNNPSSILQLREVVSVVKGKQINGEELLEEGKYYVMNGGTEPSGYLDEYNTPANTISISEGGNSCGYVQYNTEPFWSGGHCYSLHQKDEGVNYQYLYHFLKYKERDIMALRIGSGLPNVQKKDLERFEIRVLPIEQQNRVAEILEDISAKCDLEKKILQEWQWQKSFLLSNLFI